MGSPGPDLLQEPGQTTAGCEVKGGLASHPRTPVYARGHSQEKCPQKTQDPGVGRLPGEGGRHVAREQGRRLGPRNGP